MQKKPRPGIDGDGEALITRLLDLPHKILFHHEVDGLPHIILHELGHDGALGFNKAGYFVDNPDFDCLKGVTGYHCDECKFHKPDLWQEPRAFMDDMKDAQFHKHMISFYDKSLARKNNNKIDEEMIYSLGKKLGIKNPSGLSWKMRHGNHGIFLFDEKSMPCARRRDLLKNVVALLSFC